MEHRCMFGVSACRCVRLLGLWVVECPVCTTLFQFSSSYVAALQLFSPLL